jgi:hypothetical protein
VIVILHYAEHVLAVIGVWTVQAFVRYHVREFRLGLKMAECERNGGHIYRRHPVSGFNVCDNCGVAEAPTTKE